MVPPFLPCPLFLLKANATGRLGETKPQLHLWFRESCTCPSKPSLVAVTQLPRSLGLRSLRQPRAKPLPVPEWPVSVVCVPKATRVPTFCSFQPKLCKGCWVKSLLLAGPATLSNSSLLHQSAEPWTGRLRPLSHPWVCDSEGPLMALGPDLLTCELRTGLDSKLR